MRAASTLSIDTMDTDDVASLVLWVLAGGGPQPSNRRESLSFSFDLDLKSHAMKWAQFPGFSIEHADIRGPNSMKDSRKCG